VQNENPVISLGNVQQPLFTSGSKFSHGCDVPEELQGLSIAEQALISRVQCVMTCQHIKGTGTGSSTNVLKSHVTFVDRTDCVQKLHQTLPLLASEVQVLVLRREKNGARGQPPRGVTLRCRKQKVESALQWLVKNNPGYFDITVSQERLAKKAKKSNTTQNIQQRYICALGFNFRYSFSGTPRLA